MQSITTNITNCARCGDDHDKLKFTEFSKNPIIDSDGTIWDFWALCPITKEPVLLKVFDDGEQK